MCRFSCTALIVKKNLLSPSLTRDVSLEMIQHLALSTVLIGNHQGKKVFCHKRNLNALTETQSKNKRLLPQETSSFPIRNIGNSKEERKISAVANTGRQPFSAWINEHMTFYWLKKNNALHR